LLWHLAPDAHQFLTRLVALLQVTQLTSLVNWLLVNIAIFLVFLGVRKKPKLGVFGFWLVKNPWLFFRKK
jgi:hypothetical protein